MPNPWNTQAYKRARQIILSTNPRCHVCGGPGANSLDHVPALWQHTRPHRDGSGCCSLKPAHLRCNQASSGGWRAVQKKRAAARRRRGFTV